MKILQLKFKAIILSLYLIITSCGAPTIESDIYHHCEAHKYANDQKTCSMYHLIKPDPKVKNNSQFQKKL